MKTKKNKNITRGNNKRTNRFKTKHNKKTKLRQKHNMINSADKTKQKS